MPSVQLTTYLHARASGATVEAACEQSGIGIVEAMLHEAGIESGELELPHVRAPAPARAREQSNEEGKMVSGEIAGDALRLFIERIERLHEERQGIADDIKDVFQEAKATGFDTATMKRCIKLRKMGGEAKAEAEALLASYLSALGAEAVDEAVTLGIAA